MKPTQKKISNKKEDKTKHSKFLNMQKKSLIRGSLDSGSTSRNAETAGLKIGRSCKKEINSTKEIEELHLTDFTSKKSRKTPCAEKPQTARKSEVVNRRRRTKIEMALSYEARSPQLVGHILEDVAYDCSANLERHVRDKSNNMKDAGSFWILDDNLIRSVQKKMGAPEEQDVQSSEQTTKHVKHVPLVSLKSLSMQRAGLCLNKELDVANIGKTIIQVSHAPPAKNKEPSNAPMHLESFRETSGFEQTDNVPALNSSDLGLEKSVQNKESIGSGTVEENTDHNLSLGNEFSTERGNKERHLITEEFSTSISALEDVAGASLSSVQVETQSNELRSGELLSTSHNTLTGTESMLDYSGDIEVSDTEIEDLEDDSDTGHSLLKNKEMMTHPNVTVERISQEHFLFVNDDNFDVIETACTPVIQTDISILNSVSLGRCRNMGTDIINEKDKEVKTPSAQQEMDVPRTHRRKRKLLFTRRKKCKNASPNAAKFLSADSCNSWSFENSITEQVLSGCRLAESGRVADMGISPEVESAASVLAMMSSGGRLFSEFQHGERSWDSGGPRKKYQPTANSQYAAFQQAGAYMCDVCGHWFVDFTSLRQHMGEHERAIKKSSRRKQLRHKQTATKTKVAQTSPSAAPAVSADVKSCDSVIDKHVERDQDLESKVQQSGDNPVTAVTGPVILSVASLSQSEFSQIVEEGHGGTMANASVGSVANSGAVVKLNENPFDRNEIALKDVNLNQKDGTLQTVEVDRFELGGTPSPANARSVLSKDTVLDAVNLNQRLSDKTGSVPQTNVASSQNVVRAHNMVEMSESEKERVRVENAKMIQMDMKGAAFNTELVGQDRRGPSQSGITDIPYGHKDKLNSSCSTSGMHSAHPQSSTFSPIDKHLKDLVEQVVDAMKMSGSVFPSKYPARPKIDAAYTSDVCYICNHKFSNAANARKHILMTHNSYRPHKCEVCGKAFPYPSSLMEHMTSHATDPQKLVCYICGKVFIRQSGLRKHIKEQHESTRPHGCDVCGKRFIYRCLLREHQRSHSEERTFKCTECACVFKQTSNLLMHMKKRHRACECPAGNCTCQPAKAPRPMPAYSCVVCLKTFHVRKQLEVHLDKHDGRIGLTCHICQKEFPNKFVLSKHRMKHQETKTYSCEVCSRDFLSKPALKSHTGTHLGVKPFQCENCGKQYSTKNSLKVRLCSFVYVVFVYISWNTISVEVSYLC